jgi:hypothetical protein
MRRSIRKIKLFRNPFLAFIIGLFATLGRTISGDIDIYQGTICGYQTTVEMR